MQSIKKMAAALIPMLAPVAKQLLMAGVSGGLPALKPIANELFSKAVRHATKQLQTHQGRKELLGNLQTVGGVLQDIAPGKVGPAFQRMLGTLGRVNKGFKSLFK